jgi:hypothetical protein
MSTVTTTHTYTAYKVTYHSQPNRGEEDTVDYPALPAAAVAMANPTAGLRRSHGCESGSGPGAARQHATKVAVSSSPKAAMSASALTLDDFGGRSDALGG